MLFMESSRGSVKFLCFVEWKARTESGHMYDALLLDFDVSLFAWEIPFIYFHSFSSVICSFRVGFQGCSGVLFMLFLFL